MPRWPGGVEGMKKPKRARRRKPETAKVDLKPPLGSPWRAGCPSRGGIRRACREVPGRNRGGYPEDELVGQRWDKVEPAYMRRRRYSFTHRKQGVCGRHGTEEQRVTSGGLAGSPGGTGVNRPISESEVASNALSVDGRLCST